MLLNLFFPKAESRNTLVINMSLTCMVRFVRMLLLVFTAFVPFGVSGAEGKIIEDSACGEFTIIKVKRRYLVAAWHDGAVLKLDDRVTGDFGEMGIQTFEKADGSTAVYHIFDVLRPRRAEISATGDPRQKMRLMITCTSESRPGTP